MIHVHAEVVRNTKTAVVKIDKNKNKYKHKGGEILLFCSKNICNWRIKMDVFLINEKIESLSQNLKEIKESL